MLSANLANNWSDLMFSGVINKNSSQIDVLEVLSGTYGQYEDGEWQIVKNPFLLVMTAVVDAGSHALPFTVTVPVPGILYGKDGNIESFIVRPGDTAVNITSSGLAQIMIIGDQAGLKAIR